MELLRTIVNILMYLVLFKVIMSWLIQFQVLNVNQPQVRKIWELLQRIFEPIYAQIRRVIPPFQGMDFSPMVIIFALVIIRNML